MLSRFAAEFQIITREIFISEEEYVWTSLTSLETQVQSWAAWQHGHMSEIENNKHLFHET